jgi:hypothetical protein
MPSPPGHPRTTVGVFFSIICPSGLPYGNAIELSAPIPITPLPSRSIMASVGSKRCPRQEVRRGTLLIVPRHDIVPRSQPHEAVLPRPSVKATAVLPFDATSLSPFGNSRKNLLHRDRAPELDEPLDHPNQSSVPLEMHPVRTRSSSNKRASSVQHRSLSTCNAHNPLDLLLCYRQVRFDAIERWLRLLRLLHSALRRE